MSFLVDIPECWLELSTTATTRSWQQSQSGSTHGSRWNAYLNQLCLQAVLPWLQEGPTTHATAWLNTNASTKIWDVVNGIAVQFDVQNPAQVRQHRRLILIPTETIDTEELRVPQEWVDIPEWLGDYYLAVQVNPDEGWIKPWGYTTHLQLKTRGEYDPGDRTYSLSQDHLISDLNVFWVEQQFCPDAQTRCAVDPLPQLSQAQADQLIERLGNPELLIPRLEIPFQTWGALIEQPQWRDRLYRKRQGLTTINLQRWFENLVQPGWQSLEAFQSSLSQGSERFALSSFRNTALADPPQVLQVKPISLEETQVLLVLELTKETNERVGVKAQLYPNSTGRHLPKHVRFSLLSDMAETLSTIEARSQDNMIQLPRFKCDSGFNFSLQVALAGDEITEDFIA
ncbi:MAG: DUF1822 family protein [Microcoleaceae cyanobacterium]